MVRESYRVGNRRIVVQMPTGAGKTITAAEIIKGARAKGNAALFTTPAISLIDQTVSAFEGQGITGIGVMQANHQRTDPLAKVQVATLQTLAMRDIPESALVIVDECHVENKVIARMMAERPDVFFLGLSATPWRVGMARDWQDLVIPVTIGDLIEQGLLSQFIAFAPSIPDLTGVKTEKGDYALGQLEEVMGEAKIMGDVVQTWLERGERRPTLCFCVNRAHAAQVAGAFAKAGISAGYVDGKTDSVERELINAQFRAGEVQIICSVRTMTTGVDLPVSCIIDAAPTKSEMLHVQKIGRGLRVNPGTEDCLILDHAGNSLRLGLVTDIHHEELKQGAKEERGKREKTERLPTECPKCTALKVGRVCHACGHEAQPPRLESAEGELKQISGKAKQPTREDKQRFWSMALHLSLSRGKGDRMAKGLYKSKFGVWPRGLESVTMPPDGAFMDYDRSRRIAYAKRMEKERQERENGGLL